METSPTPASTRPEDYEVQHMTKMVCGHSDVLSEDDAGRANREVPRISMNEVRAALKRMKSGKAVGPGGMEKTIIISSIIHLEQAWSSLACFSLQPCTFIFQPLSFSVHLSPTVVPQEP